MKETEIIEGNKLIAEFMGWEKHDNGDVYLFPNLYPLHNIDDEENTGWITDNIANAEFHSSWSWLMPVMNKIMNMEYDDGDYPYARTFGMKNESTLNPMVRLNRQAVFEAETLIEAVWLAVVDFIKHHNPPFRSLARHNTIEQ